MRYKIYSDIKYCPEDFDCHMLVPFWGLKANKNSVDYNRFDKWFLYAKDYYEFSDLKNSDFVIYPDSGIIPMYKERYYNFINFQNLIPKDKKIIVFFNDDFDGDLFYKNNVYIFRTSFYKNKQKNNEFALSCFSEDWGEVKKAQWNKKPTIGFCGKIWSIRGNILNKFEKFKKIKNNFIKRENFWNGALGNYEKMKVSRNDFISNMSNSDYSLCIRGIGNNSYRLYESMMSGRIPILINTNCCLPYDFLINYKDLFPIIEENELEFAEDKILEFHNNFENNNEKFFKQQLLMRNIWEEYLSPVGFFKNLYKHFS